MGQGMTGSQDYSESTANLIDEEVQRILVDSYDKCMNILVEHKKELIDLSEILIEKEVLDADQVIHILKHGKLPDENENEDEDEDEKNDATDLVQASKTDEDLSEEEKKDEPKNKDSDSEKD